LSKHHGLHHALKTAIQAPGASALDPSSSPIIVYIN
jgi:hypothetical protein